MDAQGALDSLLGRLTAVLVNEAQLLGRVRGDVEFIKDEMECMNSLIMQLTEAQYRDHLVRPWMKQVVGLTRDCEGNVEHYIHYVGSRPADDGHLRRALRFLRTIRARHHIASRIRELKIRARDVGDRRHRYGVTVPATGTAGMNDVDAEPAREEEDLRRRAVLLRGTEPPADDDDVVRRGIRTLIECLSMEPETTEQGAPLPQVRVFSILGYVPQQAAFVCGHLIRLQGLVRRRRCRNGTYRDTGTSRRCSTSTCPRRRRESGHIIWRLAKCSAFARKMLMHLLYVNPTMTPDNAISMCMGMNKSVDQTMAILCYNELPTKYRSCLLHLTIFPQGHVIKTARLARRWIAEGLITTSDETESEADKVGHYWDVLFIRGFISPVEISAEGNMKSFTLKDEVHKVIAKIAREVNIVDTNLPIDFAHHLSIHNRILLPKSHSGGESEDIAASLPSLAASPQWILLKVLDLEGCHGLEKHHLKSLCKILLLKYLSLRNTDVTELPKQIKELQCLDTLDVRQTKVRVLATKAIVLPIMKHFLAGHKVSAANDSTTSEYSFCAVQMPLCIEKMNNMEILSHVRVFNSKELASIAQLLKLRKLGVALHGKHVKLSDLFCQTKKLHRCLRSLSIRIDPQGHSEIQYLEMVDPIDPQGHSEIQDLEMVDPLHSTPEFIERLNISGIPGGIRHLIEEHHKLTKITLSEAQLKEDDLAILGKLSALHSLRLQHNSYTESEIVFRGEEFQSLNYLLVEVKDITKISFSSGAAPKLERIVWSFARTDVLSGLNHLRKLKNLELNGDCDLHPIEEELFWHPNDPTLKHKPHHQGQEDRSALPTSLQHPDRLHEYSLLLSTTGSLFRCFWINSSLNNRCG
ncbi:unnamed protein product [Miscanthus lutarioriparius]|uniref:Rx N-terminal domain-containing protein n=1 Tax=Miscanthus lutarioriparius TaxID=422564 RepID=A0A811Q381_9POAL|nr:unnamed protein product [Miscanthus lutarioriparius]